MPSVTEHDHVADPALAGGAPHPMIAFAQLLLRQKWLIAGLALLSATVAVGVSLVQEPTYDAFATVELQGRNDDFLDLRKVNLTASEQLFNSHAYLETQAQVLQSRSLAARVVDALAIDKRPEFQEPSVSLRVMLGLPGLPPLSPREQAIKMVMDALSLTATPDTRLIRLSLSHADPAFAARILNKVIAEYIAQTSESQMKSVRQVGELLSQQVEEGRKALEKSEQALQAFATASGILPSEQSPALSEEKLRLTQAALLEAQADRVLKQSRYNAARNTPPEALPDALNSEVLKELAVKLSDARRAVSARSVESLPLEPRLRELTAELEVLDAQWNQQLANILRGLRNEYEAAFARERMLAATFASESERVGHEGLKYIEYASLKREVDSNRRLVDELTSRAKEAGVAAAVSATSVRVIDWAEPPPQPARPRLTVNAAAGFLAGGLLASLIVLARAALDRTIRAPGAVPQLLKIPELGAIPRLDTDRGQRLPRRRQLTIGPPAVPAGATGFREAVGALSLPPELVSWRSEDSVIAESFRATMTSMLLRSGGSGVAVAVTSPKAGDGKTTVTGNLAMALAEIRQSTLIIDGDLRRPRMHKIFHVANDSGLSDLLSEHGTSGIAQQIRPTGVPGLSLLPAGPQSQACVSLLSTQRLPQILQWARDHFDFVLIDAPPLITAGSRQIAHAAGGAVLVFRAAETAQHSAYEALSLLSEDGTPVRGSVLNGWVPDRRALRSYASYLARSEPA